MCFDSRVRSWLSFICLTGAACIEPTDRRHGLPEPQVQQVAPAPPAPVPSFVPDPMLLEACSGAAEYLAPSEEYEPFSSMEAALAALTGTWVRCADSTVSDHAGVVISADGSWRDFAVVDGELVARSGFGYEGGLRLTDIGEFNGSPGLTQVNFLPFGMDAVATEEGGPLKVMALASATVLRVDAPLSSGVAVYLPTTLPVRSPSVSYSAGERAGLAACNSDELGVITRSEEAQAQLEGDFVLCSGQSIFGGLAQLHFEAGEVELRDGNGQRRSRTPYRTLVDSFDQLTELLLETTVFGQFGWRVMLSRQPVKLWIDERGSEMVLTALPRELP